MKLHELLKVITHSNYTIAMMNIVDVYELLSKFDISTPKELSWKYVDDTLFELSTKKDVSITRSPISGLVLIGANVDKNLLNNLKVLEIQEDFTIVVGYEKFNS